MPMTVDGREILSLDRAAPSIGLFDVIWRG